MDRAEAKHRHANGTPHVREHCETCAEEYWAQRLKPAHYREAAADLRKVGAARVKEAPDVVARAVGLGIEEAARLLDSYARDLPSLPVEEGP